MNSIRRFLVIVLLAIIVLSTFIATLRGYLSSMSEAEVLFNQRLQQQVDLLNYALPGLQQQLNQSTLPLTYTAGNSDAQTALEFQLISSNGELLAHSTSMPNYPVAELKIGFSHVNFDGYRWHLFITPSAVTSIWYILAERDDQRYRLAEAMILQAVYPMVAAVPLIGIMIWLIIGVGLKPIQRFAHELQRRTATDLEAISLQDVPTELTLLVHSTNELLRRLEASFVREKRFSGDAAHELRTPIAALKIHCDNLLQELQSISSTALPIPRSAQKVQQGIVRISYLVEQILMLNRTSPDHFMGNFSPVNLTQLIKNIIAEHSLLLEEKQHSIEFDGETCWVMGDRTALEILFNNLLSNAIKYTPPKGMINMNTWLKEGKVIVEVMDNGIGIPEEQYQRVFDRFYRVGGDRHYSQVSGCGLGLAIAKQVATLHNTDIKLAHSCYEYGLLVTVTFNAFTPSLDDRRKAQKNYHLSVWSTNDENH